MCPRSEQEKIGITIAAVLIFLAFVLFAELCFGSAEKTPSLLTRIAQYEEMAQVSEMMKELKDWARLQGCTDPYIIIVDGHEKHTYQLLLFCRTWGTPESTSSP